MNKTSLIIGAFASITLLSGCTSIPSRFSDNADKYITSNGQVVGFYKGFTDILGKPKSPPHVLIKGCKDENKYAVLKTGMDNRPVIINNKKTYEYVCVPRSLTKNDKTLKDKQ